MSTRDARRAAFAAHWLRMTGSNCICDGCQCQLDGESFVGQSLATAGRIVCFECAREAVADAQSATPTIECKPVTNEHATAMLRAGIHSDPSGVAA